MLKLLVFSLLLTIQIATISADGYIAGVFEHYLEVSDTPENTILKNIQTYYEYASSAKNQNAQILVFPEYGLTGPVTDPAEYAIDLTHSKTIFNKLRNISYDLGIYSVINILEKEEKDGSTKYYNSVLVFDKIGSIILKYRKINLYQEPNLTPGDENQKLTFTTDFGVTFGVFTGFDILFNNPSQRVLKDSSVTDILYPTAMVATMPFFTSLSIQHGYVLANGVNLLAASYGKPKEGHGGSGIYLSDGKIAEIYISDSASAKRIIQKVPQSTRIDRSICPTILPYGLPGDLDRNNVTNYETMKMFKPSDYTFKSVDLSQKNQKLNVCNNDLCCSFDLTINTSGSVTSNKYKVAAFDGITDIDGSNYHLRVCSLLACKDDSNNSCGDKIDKTGVTFTKITVKGTVKREDETWYRPVTSDAFLLPFSNTVFCSNVDSKNSTFVQLTTTAKASDILVFGIIGKTVSAASGLQTFGILFLVLVSLIKNSFV